MLPRYATVAAYSLLILVVGFTPFAFAAESSEPGDLLYPIKTAVNEPVKKAVRTVIPHKEAEPDPELRDSSEYDDTDEDEADINGSLLQVTETEAATSTKKELKKSIKEADKDLKNLNDVPVVTDILINVNETTPVLDSTDDNLEKKIKKKTNEIEDTVQEVIDVPKNVVEEVEDTLEETIEEVLPKINLSL
jgi:hypothetical protein